MWPFTQSHPLRRRTPARRPLRVEALERRELMAGDITARLAGSTLVLTGDSLGNQLLVTSVSGGQIAVLGGDTTVNGSTSPFITGRPVTSIVASLNGGDDVIGFGNSAQGFADQLIGMGVSPPDVVELQDEIDSVANGTTTFSLPGSLTITTAAGADAIAIIGVVGGSVTATLGSAPTGGNGNRLTIGGTNPAYASRVGGAMSIVGGGQRDVVEFLTTAVGGAVVAALGNGENYLGMRDTSIASLTYTGGTGVDGVSSPRLRVRNGVSIVTGAGADSVFVGAGGDGLASVGRSVVINTGSGDDFASVAGDVNGAVSVITGQGNDQVGVYSASVGLDTVINTGTGNDAVDIVGFQGRFNLVVSLGAGNDRVLLADITTTLAACLYGGPGTNALTYYEEVPAGIRWFSYVQFQTVTVIV